MSLYIDMMQNFFSSQSQLGVLKRRLYYDVIVNGVQLAVCCTHLNGQGYLLFNY